MDSGKVKVAMVTGSLRLGGAERMMLNLANELNKKAEVILVRLTEGDDLSDEVDQSVRTVSFGKRRTMAAFFRLRKFLKREKPDALISTQIHVNLFCMLVKLMTGVQTKIILREATTPGVHFAANAGFKTTITRKLMRWLYPKSSAVVVNSAATGRDMIENGFALTGKVHLVYNPVLTDNFKKKIAEKGSHRFFGKAPVFISVGRLAAAKNIRLLIQAFANVIKKVDARLIIVGDGAERKNLEDLVARLKLADKVDFTGQLINPFPLVSKADVFVLPSDYEGSPGALVEAMACGIQLVSTNSSGGAGEILMEGKLGALVPVNDEDALAAAMLGALEKKIPREALAAGAGRFESAAAAGAYLSLIYKICGRP